MTDPTGVPAALGVEAVECLQEDGNVTVRVTGRRRRRRPDWHGPGVLVIEANGRRHRFPAMPEPPSLSGALPGTWRMSFSVAAELAPQLAGRAWLQLGSLTVPLPVFAEAKLRAVADDARAHRAARANPLQKRATSELRRAELAAHRAEAEALDLLERVRAVELELEQARRAARRVDAAERGRRIAEQRAHAEAALRAEADDRAAAQARHADEAVAHTAALADRVSELEREQHRLRRIADQAEHAAAAARAAQARAERALAELTAAPPAARAPARAWRLALEAELLSAARAAPPPEPRRRVRAMPVGAAASSALDAELAMLRLRARVFVASPASALERERRRWLGAARAIEEIRLELDQLRQAHAGEQPSPGEAPPPAAQGVPAPPELASGRKVQPWLPHVFRALVRTDPISAGRLVLALLPAQGIVWPLPVAYDLVLSEVVCVRVTAGTARATVEFHGTPRPREDVQFQVHGDLGKLARLLAAGPLRRRVGRGVGRVHGDLAAFAALIRLVRSSLSLHQLHDAGVRLDPGLALAVCARMLEPASTRGEQFSIAHQLPESRTPGLYLCVGDGCLPYPLDRPPGEPPAATIVCPGETLLPALAGARGASVSVRGDERPVALIARWLERAQTA